MLFISYRKGKRSDKAQKRQLTQEKAFRLTEFQKWQSNRVVKDFDKTETGSRLSALIARQLAEYKRLKSEKPAAWEAQADVVKNTIAVSRIEYIEELIKFLRKQKGIYKTTIKMFEEQLQLFKNGSAWLVE